MIAPGFIREAGMFANTGAKLPPGVGTRTPQDVAAAVIRAIEHNRAELDVAPLGLRVGYRPRVGGARGRRGGQPPAGLGARSPTAMDRGQPPSR